MFFLLEYLKHPRMIGAIAPSGKALSCKMMEPIDFRKAKVIVEYGPGTGSFTKELVIRRRVETTIVLLEQNERFCEQLKQLFVNQPNLHIIHAGAQDVKKYLDVLGYTGADYVISGLPFACLPTKLSKRILVATKDVVGERGKFITFQYSLVKKRFFEEYFRITRCLREMKNLPPAYVLVMKNDRKKQIRKMDEKK